MSILKIVSSWIKENKDSDIRRVKVTYSGSFYMKSEDLFNNEKETLELLEKLNKSVKNYKKANKDYYAHSE